jgi:hypothetical protein
MATAASAILCVATGFLMLALGFGRSIARPPAFWLCSSLSVGFGVAVFSIAYFLARASGFMHLWIIDCASFAILLSAWLIRKGNQGGIPSWLDQSKSSLRSRFLKAAFILGVAAASYSAIVRALGHPYGSGWDSFAIWNLHARFLYRGGADWGDGFTRLIPWSHPDYPLLLPAAIAHFWTVAGHETPIVPTIIGLVFTFATVALLFAALDLFAGRTSAVLGGMALLCSPFFIELGTWQYADVPLSFFILATLVLFHSAKRSIDTEDRISRNMLALGGFSASCAAWTKNEGILFLCAILLTRVFLKPQPASRTLGQGTQRLQLLPVLGGLLPIFCVLVFFKRFIAPPGDLFSDASTMLHRVTDPSRYWAVLTWYGKEFLRFGHWLLIPLPLLMLAYYLSIRKRVQRSQDADIRASAWALTLTAAGYFFIYLITPYDIYWHLRFSLARLFIQIWPSAIFLFFLRVHPHISELSAGGA